MESGAEHEQVDIFVTNTPPRLTDSEPVHPSRMWWSRLERACEKHCVIVDRFGVLKLCKETLPKDAAEPATFRNMVSGTIESGIADVNQMFVLFLDSNNKYNTPLLAGGNPIP